MLSAQRLAAHVKALLKVGSAGHPSSTLRNIEEVTRISPSRLDVDSCRFYVRMNFSSEFFYSSRIYSRNLALHTGIFVARFLVRL